MKKIILSIIAICSFALQNKGQEAPSMFNMLAMQAPTLRIEAPICPAPPHTDTPHSTETTEQQRPPMVQMNEQLIIIGQNLPQEYIEEPLKIKKISKSYLLSSNDKVNISNVYGSITFKTWNKNEIKVDAEIKAYASNADDAQKLIDNVTIANAKNGGEVVFKTHVENNKGIWGSGSKNGMRWRREVKIYMTVHLPANTPLSATQQYGNMTIDDYEGPTSLKVQYGRLTTGNLNNENNYISAQYTTVNLKDVNKATIKQQYGSGLTIASIEDLNLNAQYAAVRIGEIKGTANIKQQYGNGLSIASVNQLQLDAQYAAVKLGSVKNSANIKVQYGGGVTIEQIDNLSLTTQYATVTIGQLSGFFTAKSQYGGGLNVRQIVPSSKEINLDTEYITTTLGFAPNYGGSLNVNAHYSSFKAGDNVNAKRLDNDDKKSYRSIKEYSGTVGKGGPSTIKVTARYSTVTFR